VRAQAHGEKILKVLRLEVLRLEVLKLRLLRLVRSIGLSGIFNLGSLSQWELFELMGSPFRWALLGCGWTSSLGSEAADGEGQVHKLIGVFQLDWKGQAWRWRFVFEL
jgi:hypothetical protein